MPYFRELRLLSLALLDSTVKPLSPAGCTHNMIIRHFTNNQSFGKYGSCFTLKLSIPPLLPITSASYLHTEVLNKNMIMKRNEKITEYSNPNSKGSEKKNLVIMLSWMLAKGKHIDKYVKIYLDRGFDVLVVNLPPMDLLFPTTGSQVLAQHILSYLDQHQEFDKVLVHGFSVGAYLFGELLVKLKQNQTQYENIMNRFVGMIFDSAVDFAGIPKGFPRAVSKNPFLIKMLELYTNAHLRVMHGTATQHYLKSSETFHFTVYGFPILLLVSEGDLVGNPKDNQALANDWKNNGVDVKVKVWPKSSHCNHMINYPDDYMNEVEAFLEKVKLPSKPSPRK